VAPHESFGRLLSCSSNNDTINARAIYAFGKVYMGRDAGDPMKLHVADVQRVRRTRRKKLAASEEPPKEMPETEKK
jgi:hypothetical protein